MFVYILFLVIKGKERIKGIKIGNYSKIDEWKKDVFHLKIFSYIRMKFLQEKRVGYREGERETL